MAFALVGVGAAAYAPAKYGLVTELAKPAQLIVANAWIEISTVCAVLLGVVLGGALVSQAWLTLRVLPHAWIQVLGEGAYTSSVFLLLCLYVVAGGLDVWVPDSGVRYPPVNWSLRAVGVAFWQDQKTLWQEPLGGIGLSVTTLFWA
jgi:MFS family permease